MVLRTVVNCIRFSTVISSSKNGFGPYRLHRKGIHHVGTEPSPLKYHVLPDKKPEQSYGLQGTNHLLPAKGKVAAKLPTRVMLKKDKVYSWCSCGYSNNQPLCDGTHNTFRVPNMHVKPVRFIPEKDMEVWFCNCKQTKNRPFCDGTHSQLVEKDKLDGIFD
uniref:Iron-binding zinc finger CDGSH type domain-containing protein n=1 Tax=Panagrolaimus sp. JU765 TaxID=591449 RepID=A0AC34RI72_9BILA